MHVPEWEIITKYRLCTFASMILTMSRSDIYALFHIYLTNTRRSYDLNMTD
jgi:hypothetical protein